MRTRPAHILPSCHWCNGDHNPDIECRLKPESTRFQLMSEPRRRIREVVKDVNGNIVAVKEREL